MALFQSAITKEDPEYGSGIAVIDDAELAELTHALDAGADPLLGVVVKVVSARDYKPPVLPAAAQRLMHMAGDPNVDFTKVEEVLNEDPGIAGKILSVVNSPLYRGRAEIASTRQAISRLGVGKIRDIAFQVAADSKVFNVPGYGELMNEYRRHARGAAFLTRHICTLTNADADLAFMCGLLHDLGKPIVVGIVSDFMRANRRQMPPPAELLPRVDALNCRVGALVAGRWQLPAPIQIAVGFHENYAPKGQPHKLALAVHCANLLCRHTGIGEARVAIDQKELDGFKTLGLNPQALADLLKRAESVAELV